MSMYPKNMIFTSESVTEGHPEPKYGFTAAYGHFGRKGFAWERVDATHELQARAKKA